MDKTIRGVFTDWNSDSTRVLELRGFKNRFLEPSEVTYKWDDLIPFVKHMATLIPGYDKMTHKQEIVNWVVDSFSKKVGVSSQMFDLRVHFSSHQMIDDWATLILQLLMKKSFPSLSSIYFGGNVYVVAGTPNHQEPKPVQETNESLNNDVLGEVMALTASKTFGMMNLLSKSTLSKKVWYEKYIDTLPFQCMCRALREYTDRKADASPLSDVDVRARFNIIWRCIATGINFYIPGLENFHISDEYILYRQDLYDNFFKLLNEEISDLIIYEYINNLKYNLVNHFLANLIFYGRIDLVARYLKMKIFPQHTPIDIRMFALTCDHLFGPIPDWFVPTYESILSHPGLRVPPKSLYHMIKTGVFTKWSIPMIISAIDKGYVKTPLAAESIDEVVGDCFFNRLSQQDKQKIYDHSDKDPIWRVLLYGEGEVPTEISDRLANILALNERDVSNTPQVRSEKDYKYYNKFSTKVDDGVYVSIDEENRIRPAVPQKGGGLFMLSLIRPPVTKYIFSFLSKVNTDDIILGSYWYQTIEITMFLTYYSPEIPFEDYLKVLAIVIRDSQRIDENWDDIKDVQKKKDLFFRNFPSILNRL